MLDNAKKGHFPRSSSQTGEDPPKSSAHPDCGKNFIYFGEMLKKVKFKDTLYHEVKVEVQKEVRSQWSHCSCMAQAQWKLQNL